MVDIPRISDAEWEVMKVIWSKSPLTANEVIDALEGNTDWKPKTIRTLINRLVEKKALGVNQKGKFYSYYPLVAEEECLRAETQSFLKRLYGGAMKPFLVNFLREEKLSPEDIEELKSILNEKAK
ncbi:BlaI/MecI/CopY family transcriptional regulator [Marinicrinis lubricantis]|uniref:BlaI/MecI/CopY family transcriptional regulator n=1 Tax=Marinicrinis lubricantis TaxID=2086470 RepID=A0ABW1IN60_9BACL